MKLYRFQKIQHLPVDIDKAWDFFSNPRNLRNITPPWLDFTITDPNLQGLMYEGMIITYRIRPIARFTATWITEITHVQKPYYFIDEQRFGPYRFWHHQHIFRPVDSGIEMEDLLHYALPFPAISSLVHRLFVRKKIEEIFTFRQKTLEKIFS
jgi:ligand-binding SRPBCC domain-containing protein